MSKKLKEQIKNVLALSSFFKENNNLITFKITHSKDGWIAECEQQTAIMTAGNEINPTQEIISKRIAELMYDVFEVPKDIVKFNIKQKSIESPFYSVSDVLCLE